MQITEQQQRFFDTFGYLVFRGLMRDEIEAITSEFRAVFDDKGVAHDASKRTCMVPFIDQREQFCSLLDDPSIRGIASGLLGEDFNYLSSDGNYYTGDTHWHQDGNHAAGTYIKLAFYLDPVTRDSGALRVIPGSHRLEMRQWQDPYLHRVIATTHDMLSPTHHPPPDHHLHPFLLFSLQ